MLMDCNQKIKLSFDGRYSSNMTGLLSPHQQLIVLKVEEKLWGQDKTHLSSLASLNLKKTNLGSAPEGRSPGV